MKQILPILSLLALLVSCASPEKMLDRGNYDAAIDLAIRKLAGKDKKKEKYVVALEDAFARITAEEMRKADRLKAADRPENWGRIYDIYKRIDHRQDEIRPLLPLTDQYGIKANFRFVRVDDLLKEAREEAAAYHYEKAKELLAIAGTGDRLAARKAYTELQDINRYYRTYKDREVLENTALELGTTYVRVELENWSNAILPAGLERELLQLSQQDLNSKWKVFHTRPLADMEYDYRVSVKLLDVSVSPERISERQYQESREIEDGFEYVLDKNGNVAKDTLGNDLKVPKHIKIAATVFETYQTKAASILAKVEFYDEQNGQLLSSRELSTETVFEHYASTYRGDKRALSKDSRRRIGNRPLPFPSDGAMVLDAARDLKPAVSEKIRRNNALI